MRRAPEDVYQTLIRAGFPRESAITLTAIAGAESGYDNDAVGDVALQDQNWGPSFGLFQIRTEKRATGTGAARDINRLATGDLEQARAAYVISRGGNDFTPWTVYNTGAYQVHLEAAQAAAARVDGDGPFPTLGPDWLPWNWPSVVGNEAVETGEELVSGARAIALELTATGVGLVLVVLGLWVLARRGREAVT